MKRLFFIISLTLVLVSCGTRSGYFSLEGRLLNLNQGEFYVYSPDGVFDGVDTIRVDGGRFAFETPCRKDGTVILVFPNYSELPLFAEAGRSVTIKGDASHLKEVEVEGGKENKLMNDFRQQLLKASPPEVVDYAERFIRDNAESVVSVYVLKKYFVTRAETDIKRTVALAEILQDKHPHNGEVARMLRYAKAHQRVGRNSGIPSFSERDVNGVNVSDALLRNKVAVVFTWADWDFASCNMRRRLLQLASANKDKLVLLGINLDPSAETCKLSMSNDTVKAITLCDQEMFNSPLLERFALGGVSDNIIFNKAGKAVERGLGITELETRIKSMIN